MVTYSTFLKILAAGTVLCLPFFAHARSGQQLNAPSSEISVAQNVTNFSKFKPRPSQNAHVDYDVWNTLLESMVLYTGPSTRSLSPRRRPITGNRVVLGHTSRYRMEGNRIPFSGFKPAYLENVVKYREELE